jgi:putative ABC transport system substrate-binding protein
MIRSVVAVALALGLLAIPLAAKAQPTGKVYRIGILTPFSLSASRRDTPTQAFFDELRQLGWIEGQNFVLEWPDSEGKVERMPQLAAELVRRQVDLIVASTTAGARAAQAATKRSPSSSGSCPTRSGRGSWKASPGQAGTSPV